LKKNTEVQEFRSSGESRSVDDWVINKFQKEIKLIKIDRLFYMKISQKII